MPMSPLTLELVMRHEREPFALRHARSLRVTHAGTLVVRRGRVWLTVDGEGQDRVLGPGDRLALHSGHRGVIEPWSYLEAADLSWCAQAQAGAMKRLQAAFGRVWARLKPWPGATAR
jgi:Protein of unknown function (DUF2917)